MDALSRRIAARWIQAGYSGWDPPEDGPEPPDPEPEWDRLVKLFPPGMQHLLKNPKQEEDQGRDSISVSLTGEVELSEESGFSLVVEANQGTDADEDGMYGYSNETIEYSFYQGPRHWHGKDERKLKHDLREFLNHLENQDPEGYRKARP